MFSDFSACGKTNLAMLRPIGIPGYKVECVGKWENEKTMNRWEKKTHLF